MSEVKIEEVEYLAEILEKSPRESLLKIAKREGIDYYKLKRLYNKYYGKYVHVSAIYDIAKLGLKSYVAFLSVPREELRRVASEMSKNPFIPSIAAIFGFKNGISAVLHIPKDQTGLIDELLSRYSDDYEYYEVRAYPEKPKEFGEWNLSYDYAILMDILKYDARTSPTRMSEILGKSRPTIRYMIKRLEETGIIRRYSALVDMTAYDRGFCGIADELSEKLLEKFKNYEILIGVLKPRGYLVEWYFSSKEDIGAKIFEFSRYVKKFAIYYFDLLEGIEPSYKFAERVKKDGSGYRSILEF
ncbi:Lrp/AsnC family transcriptional regulator [Thermococcus sp. SY098]|uniref:Lrp/AsnC family transcriptional regulator n=1 Tax=Thermococcus sp. SY098 TaxID=3111325 RepID=UPI002D774578|nr:Lrp/AsnC family transcriptional regulator [Thermococcus sp. SY098]WRS51906.1 Lrp/AsnC family transcriptional regulator [Thermococcus sp. SY098]